MSTVAPRSRPLFANDLAFEQLRTHASFPGPLRDTADYYFDQFDPYQHTTLQLDIEHDQAQGGYRAKIGAATQTGRSLVLKGPAQTTASEALNELVRVMERDVAGERLSTDPRPRCVDVVEVVEFLEPATPRRERATSTTALSPRHGRARRTAHTARRRSPSRDLLEEWLDEQVHVAAVTPRGPRRR